MEYLGCSSGRLEYLWSTYGVPMAYLRCGSSWLYLWSTYDVPGI